MSDLSCAINLIRKYEGFNEKAYPDPSTGAEPYTIGYGTQHYPDGLPVKAGQMCTKEKALEYLFHEVQVLENELTKLNLGLDGSMSQALISFAHSVGWHSFLYSAVIDCIEQEDWHGVTTEMSQWVFDEDHKVVGNLIDRRKEEVQLFVQELDSAPRASLGILLAAFRNYEASSRQVNAIRKLEEKINPYVLSEFANEFRVDDSPWDEFFSVEADELQGICDI
jgi:lysozyme